MSHQTASATAGGTQAWAPPCSMHSGWQRLEQTYWTWAGNPHGQGRVRCGCGGLWGMWAAGYLVEAACMELGWERRLGSRGGSLALWAGISQPSAASLTPCCTIQSSISLPLTPPSNCPTATRAELLTAAQEAARVVPVIAALRQQEATAQLPLSVDTFYADVAAAAVQAGATMVNDVSGGTMDSGMHRQVTSKKAWLGAGRGVCAVQVLLGGT